jgi:hypothetical protein
VSKRSTRPSVHVRAAVERLAGKPPAARERFSRQLRRDGYVVLAVGEGKVADATEPVWRALVMRRGQPGVPVWAYSNGKWVAIVERFGETTMLEGDSFDEVEEWYYRQVEASLVTTAVPAAIVPEEEEPDQGRGYTYRDRRSVSA